MIKIDHNSRSHSMVMADKANELYEIYHSAKNKNSDVMSKMIDKNSDCYSFDKYIALGKYYSSIINSIDIHRSSGDESYGMTDKLREDLLWSNPESLHYFCLKVAELLSERSFPVSKIPDMDLGKIHEEVLSIIEVEGKRYE